MHYVPSGNAMLLAGARVGKEGRPRQTKSRPHGNGP
jgi:hypothetical protein